MSDAMIDSLRRHVRGEVLVPGAPTFTAVAKIFNVERQRTPRAVVRCTSTQDVAHAVRITGEHGAAICVRSGGHSVTGKSSAEGSVVIDVRALNALSLTGESVHAGGGVQLGALNTFLWARGRSVPTGFEPRVGLSGLLLGGGYGLTTRRDGLACDALLEAEVVLADGTVVITSAEREPELFWALRGAGAFFAVATRFTLKTNALPELVIANALFDLDRIDEVMTAYGELEPTLSRDTTACLALGSEPEVGLSVQLLGFHFGDLAAGRKALLPLAHLVRPAFKRIEAASFESVHLPGTIFPDDHAHRWRSHCFSDVKTAADAMRAYAPGLREPASVVFEHLGGAIGDVPSTATAFPHRAMQFGFVSALRWQGDAPRDVLERQQRFHDEWRPRAMGTYFNYLESDGLLEAAFGANLPRLRVLKTKFDPTDRFGNLA